MAGYNKPLSCKSAYFLIFAFTCQIFLATSSKFQFLHISQKMFCCFEYRHRYRSFKVLDCSRLTVFTSVHPTKWTLNKTSVDELIGTFVLKDMNWYWLEDMILDQWLPLCVRVCACTKCVVRWLSPCVPGCGLPRPPVSPLTALPVPLWMPILISPTLTLNQSPPQRHQQRLQHRRLHNTTCSGQISAPHQSFLCIHFVSLTRHDMMRIIIAVIKLV